MEGQLGQCEGERSVQPEVVQDTITGISTQEICGPCQNSLLRAAGGSSSVPTKAASSAAFVTMRWNPGRRHDLAHTKLSRHERAVTDHAHHRDAGQHPVLFLGRPYDLSSTYSGAHASNGGTGRIIVTSTDEGAGRCRFPWPKRLLMLGSTVSILGGSTAHSNNNTLASGS